MTLYETYILQGVLFMSISFHMPPVLIYHRIGKGVSTSLSQERFQAIIWRRVNFLKLTHVLLMRVLGR